MATLSRSAIAAVLSLIFLDSMADQFRRDVVLANILEVEDGRNENCTWSVKFDGRTAGGAYAEGADMADGDFDAHARARASLDWAEYRTGAKVSGLAEAVSRASDNSSIVAEELADAVDELALLLGAAVYSGNPGASPMQLAGLAAGVDGTAGTFANLASGTYADWLASEQTMLTADLSVSQLRAKLFRPIKDATGMDPEIAMCPGAVFDLIKDAVGDKAETVQQITVRGSRVDITAITGARAVIIDGVPFLEDRHCTANTIYGLHPRWLKIRQVPPVHSKFTAAQLVPVFKALTGADIEVADIEARMRAAGKRLTPAILPLAATGDAEKFMVKWYGQMVYKRRNAHGKVTLT